MPTQRYSKLSPEVRKRILAAAQAEFVAHGYENASLNQIIQAAGINKGSLYYYFEDKADLFITVAREAESDMLRSMGLGSPAQIVSRPAGDFWEFIRQASRLKLDFALRFPAATRLLTEAYLLASRNGLPAFQEFLRQSSEASRALLRTGQEQGAVRRDLSLDTIMDLLYSLSDVLNRPLLEDPAWRDHYDPAELERYADLQLDMFKRMLQAPTEQPGGLSISHPVNKARKE